MKSYDLLICIRCHNYFESVKDTADSVYWGTNPETTKLVFAVDKVVMPFIDAMLKTYGRDVFVGSRKWGWGVGLFGLMCESINHFGKIFPFKHFMTIDYDTLFLGKNVDYRILDRITDDKIGVLGCPRDGKRWDKMLNMQKGGLANLIGTISKANLTNQSLQGGAMVVTNSLLHDFAKTGVLTNYPGITSVTQLADDYLLPFIARVHGFSIVSIRDFAFCSWKMYKTPIGMEKKGILLTHPVKPSKGDRQREERKIRSYFKALRQKQ